MDKKHFCTTALALCLAAGSAAAEVRITSPHQPMADSQRNEFVRSCIDAVKDHWGDVGLVLKQQARHGYTESGERLLSVSGTVWENGERVEVFHQCSSKPGSEQLALYVENGSAIADVRDDAKRDQES